MIPWWEENKARLENEIQAMGIKFPQFKLGKATVDKQCHNWTVAHESQMYWLGELKTISGNVYTAVITYPNHYPGMEIQSFIIEPYITKANHRYGDGQLCLYSNDHGGRGQGTGKGMTAVSYVAWTAAWLHAHEIYQETGRWPENNFFDRVR